MDLELPQKLRGKDIADVVRAVAQSVGLQYSDGRNLFIRKDDAIVSLEFEGGYDAAQPYSKVKIQAPEHAKSLAFLLRTALYESARLSEYPQF